MRSVVLIPALASVLGPPFLSHAAGYARGSTFIAAERVFGAAVGTNRTEGTPLGPGARGTITSTDTSIGLLWSASPTLYQIPRIGFDRAVFRNVTVGLALGVSYVDTRRTAEVLQNAFDVGSTETWTLLAAPRLGWILPLSSDELGVALWMRGGITAYYLRSKTTFAASEVASNSETQTGTALTFEPTVIVPMLTAGARGVALTVAATADFALGGQITTRSTSAPATTESSRYHAFGVSFGLTAVL